MKGGDGSVAGAAKREEWPNRRGVSSGPPGTPPGGTDPPQTPPTI